MQRTWFSVLLLTAMVAVGAACGGKASDNAAEKAMESAMASQGTKADVSINSDTLEIKTEDGAMAFGDGAKLPDNWPEDVPVYAGLKLSSVVSTGDGFAIQGATPDTQDKVAAYYKEQAGKQGWAEDTSLAQAEMVMLGYSKDKRGLAVMISKQDPGTAVSITITNK